MLDVWVEECNLAFLLSGFSLVILLPVQLLLCFKVRRVWIRLLPALLCCVLILFFLVIAGFFSGFDSIGYVIFAIYAACMLVVCGLGWGIWAIAHMIRKKK